MTQQVYNHSVLLKADANNQQFYVNINVPFQVGKIVFHPARSTNADVATMWWLIRSDLTNNYCGFLEGVRANGEHQQPLIVVPQYPLTVSGQYRFWLLASSELATGAVTNHVGNVWLNIEFHEAIINKA